MQFVDKCTIKLKSGDGGNGVIAWRKEAHCPYGGPYGGNGGNGASIYAIASHNCNTLWHLKNLKHIIGKHGENGRTKVCHGANAEDIYIKVPLGTIIYDLNNHEVIGELIKEKQTILLTEGGKGGKGNFHFKSSINKAPSCNERGDKGEERTISLEIQLLSHVGILGLPNAGKSTLLSQISNAKPKIASYPFTTLVPVLGIVEKNENKLTFADIPGIIKDAHAGTGLGHDFLKHLNRCNILIHLISADINEGDPLKDYQTCINEISLYSSELFLKKRIIVLNKSDKNPDIENLKNQLIKISNDNVHVISAINQEGINELLNEIFDWFKLNSHLYFFSSNLIEKKDIKEKEIDVKIFQKNGIWNIEHPVIEYWIHKIPWNTIDNCYRLKLKLKKFNLSKKLHLLNLEKNTQINLYNLIFNYGDDHCPWN